MCAQGRRQAHTQKSRVQRQHGDEQYTRKIQAQHPGMHFLKPIVQHTRPAAGKLRRPPPQKKYPQYSIAPAKRQFAACFLNT